MRRTNSYNAYALTSLNPEMKQCVCEWLAASCAYWNEVNYQRFQAQLDTGDWSNADDTELNNLYDEYAPVLGTANAQQLKAKNTSAWEGYDELADKYEDPDDDSVTDEPGFPGFWGNRDDGYDMKSVVRNTAYEINHGADQSTLEISVGEALDNKYDLAGRGHKVRFRLKGTPRWKGSDCRLEINYDETSDCFRVKQPVEVQPEYLKQLRQVEFPSHTPPENAEHDDERVAA